MPTGERSSACGRSVRPGSARATTRRSRATRRSTAFLDASAAFVDDLDAAVTAELAAEPRPLEHFWRAADAAVGPFSEMAVELARSVGAHLDQAVRTGARRDLGGCGRPADLGGRLSGTGATRAEPEAESLRHLITFRV